MLDIWEVIFIEKPRITNKFVCIKACYLILFIAVLSKETDIQIAHMWAAIDEAKKAFAKGEVPIGAVIVKDGEIIARGHNLTETANDATSHAEINAIREASEVLGNWRLSGCEMYVTVEPCTMCAGACLTSRLDAVYAGTENQRSGAGGSVRDIFNSSEFKNDIIFEVGLLREECAVLLTEFFRTLRGNNK